MSLLDTLLADLGTTEAELSKGNSRVARLVQQEGVSETPEFRRVFSLPQRPENPDDDPDAVRLAELLTRKYGKGGMSLRPAQARALGDLVDLGGSFGDLPVGSGKTLISALAAKVTNSSRSLLIVPGSLREKTRRDFERLRVFWKTEEPAIVGVEELSREKGDTLLETPAPNLIIVDEAHKFKDLGAACTVRLERYLQRSDAVGWYVHLLLMSGTMRSLSRSLMDYWHLLRWTLGDAAMPLPAVRSEAALWDRATSVRFEGARPSAGKLGTNAEEAREKLRSRISSTPGVTWCPPPKVLSSLRLRVFSPELPDILKRAIDEAESGKRPDGETFDTEDDQFRCLRQVPLGYFSRFKIPPTHPWRRARSNWNWFVRDVKQGRQPGLDTEMQIRRAAQAGKFGRCQPWLDWAPLRTTKPETEAIWLDVEWLPSVMPTAPHIVWTRYRAPGYLLRSNGFRYYADDGLDETGGFIEDDAGMRTIVASVAANGTGRNLQHRWHRNFLLTQTTNPATYEQVFGRTYRPGQEEDTVYATLFCPSARCRSTFWSAVNEAKEQGTGLLARADIE